MTNKTQFVDVKFKACEYENGTPYISTFEDISAKFSLTFQLKKNTSFEEAKKIVEYLNQRVTRAGLRWS